MYVSTFPCLDLPPPSHPSERQVGALVSGLREGSNLSDVSQQMWAPIPAPPVPCSFGLTTGKSRLREEMEEKEPGAKRDPGNKESLGGARAPGTALASPPPRILVGKHTRG